jgi:hypothetical protein
LGRNNSLRFRLTHEAREVSDAKAVDRLSVFGAVVIAQRAGHLSPIAPFR